MPRRAVKTLLASDPVKTAEAGTLALQDHAQDQPHGHYNQRSIKKCRHALASTGSSGRIIPVAERKLVNQARGANAVNEIVLNLHMHTHVFGRHGQPSRHCRAPRSRRGLDAVLVTDHNVRIQGDERYYEEGGRRVLVLAGEEIHDRTRIPQKDHLLVFGAGRELAPCAEDTELTLAGRTAQRRVVVPGSSRRSSRSSIP